MNTAMDSVVNWYVSAYYTCTGEEVDGIQEAVVNGNSYFFYLANIHAGATIVFHSGRFYTDDPTLIVTVPVSHVEETLPAEEATKTQTIEGHGQGGTEQGGEYYSSIPEEDQREDVETLVTYAADGTPRMYVKRGTEWVEIPLISAEEVERYNNSLILKKVNAEQVGDTVTVG